MQKVKKKADDGVTALEVAREYVLLCRKMDIPIGRAIMFGSQAKGAANGDSDIDLLLVSEKFEANTLENWKMLAPVTAKLYQVEPHPYPPKHFRKSDPFLEEVKKTGVEVEI